MLTQRHKTLDELAETVAATLPDLDRAGQRLAITLYWLLTAGRPGTAADLAAITGFPQPEVAGTLGSWPAVFTGSQGRRAVGGRASRHLPADPRGSGRPGGTRQERMFPDVLGAGWARRTLSRA
jgi:hypothetical protein